MVQHKLLRLHLPSFQLNQPRVHICTVRKSWNNTSPPKHEIPCRALLHSWGATALGISTATGAKDKWWEREDADGELIRAAVAEAAASAPWRTGRQEALELAEGDEEAAAALQVRARGRAAGRGLGVQARMSEDGACGVRAQ